MGAGTGVKSLEPKTVRKIHWRSSSKYLITEELAKLEAASGATTGAISGVRVRIVAGAGVRRSLLLVEVPPVSLFLLS